MPLILPQPTIKTVQQKDWSQTFTQGRPGIDLSGHSKLTFTFTDYCIVVVPKGPQNPRAPTSGISLSDFARILTGQKIREVLIVSEQEFQSAGR